MTPSIQQPQLPQLPQLPGLYSQERVGGLGPDVTQVRVDHIWAVSKRAAPDLVRSVAAVGVMNPVTLQQVPVEDDLAGPHYRVIAGERRVDAARQAEHDVIDARVYPADARITPEVLTLAENWARRPNVGRELRAITRLVQLGYKAAQIAKDLGAPIGTVKRYVRLVGLPAALHQAVCENRIGQTLATEIVKLSPAKQQELAAQFVAQGTLSPQDVRAKRQVQAQEIRSALPAELFGTEDEAAEAAEAESPYAPSPGTATPVGEHEVVLTLGVDDARRFAEIAAERGDTALAHRLRLAAFSVAGARG